MENDITSVHNLYDNVGDPSEIELKEYTFLLPKDLMERFKSIGLNNTGKSSDVYSVSKRLARYLLCYHKLLTRRDVRTLQTFLDLPEINKQLREFDTKNNG